MSNSLEAANAALHEVVKTLTREESPVGRLALGQAALNALRDPDSPTDDGLDHLTIDGAKAQRVVTDGGKTNFIMVEIPGKGVWTFDGTHGTLNS